MRICTRFSIRLNIKNLRKEQKKNFQGTLFNCYFPFGSTQKPFCFLIESPNIVYPRSYPPKHLVKTNSQAILLILKENLAFCSWRYNKSNGMIWPMIEEHYIRHDPGMFNGLLFQYRVHSLYSNGLSVAWAWPP